VKELQKLLTYHVVSGAAVLAKDLKNNEAIKTVEGENVVAHVSSAGIKINDAAVTTADVVAFNGVVHLVDTVLMPPDMPTKSIVDLAVATPDLSTLVTALKAGGLVSTLQGAGPFTVFAPTNEAFAKLPTLYRQLLLDPKNVKELQKLLTYHVVSGAAVLAKDLKNNEAIKTVEGENVVAHVSSAGIKINDAAVTTADVVAFNGVVHVIDSVLMPGDMPSPTPSTCSMRHNTAMSADFYKSVRVSQSACCTLCTSDSRCRTAVYSPQGECHLHDALDSARPFPDAGWTLMSQTQNIVDVAAVTLL